MSSYATGWIGLVGPCINISGEGSLGSGCFCTSNSSVSLLSHNIPLSMLSVNNFRAPLTHFMPLMSFDTPGKHKKARGFLMFSGGIKRDQWHQMH